MLAGMTDEEKNSMPPAEKPAASKKSASAPAPARKSPAAVAEHLTGAEKDDVLYSRLVGAKTAETRKSASVHHLQRRLAEWGHGEAVVDQDGLYGDLTEHAVREWQKAGGHDVTGVLTVEELHELFDGDNTVNVVID